MQNLFTNVPDQVPAELTAGARWTWTRSDITAAYPTSAYTLSFRLCELSAPYTQQTVTAGKVANAHVVTVPVADTAGAYVAGDYSWQAIVTRDSDGEQVQVDHGLVKIRPDLSSGSVTASWVYQTLQAIRATLHGTASKEQSSYSIGGRSLSLRSIPELMDMEKDFSRRWKAEVAEMNQAAGRPTAGNVIRVRF